MAERRSPWLGEPRNEGGRLPGQYMTDLDIGAADLWGTMPEPAVERGRWDRLIGIGLILAAAAIFILAGWKAVELVLSAF